MRVNEIGPEDAKEAASSLLENAGLTAEQLDARRAYMREYMNRKNRNLTPEQRAEKLARDRENARLRRLKLTPEQRKAASIAAAEDTRVRRASLTREQLSAEYKKNSDRRREREVDPDVRAQRLAMNKRFTDALRDTALRRYGGTPPTCACCGEHRREFLAIDHIGGGGNKHRKEVKKATIYSWLKREGYPDGFRVLCHNCNMAIGFYKTCPHDLEKVVPIRTSKGGD